VEAAQADILKRREAEEQARAQRRAEAEAALARRHAEVEARLQTLRAQADEAESRKLRAEAEGAGAHAAASAARERALASREAEAVHEADQLVQAARAQAAALVAAARVEARQLVDQAQVTAAEAWDEARAEIAEARVAAADERAEQARRATEAALAAHAKAEAAAATLRGEAERAKVRAEGDAEQVVATAQLEADTLLSAARAEAAEIVARAALEIEALRLQRMAEAAEREAEVRDRAEALDAQERELRDLEEQLRVERARQERKGRALAEREADLAVDQAEVRTRRDALMEREQKLGAARVADLELRVEELQQRGETYKAQGLEIAAERDRLQQALDALGGADASVRLDEVVRLRARVDQLNVELATRVDVAEVTRLQREVDHLRHFREHAEATEADRQRLELSQLDLDQRVRLLRGEAERAQRARDTAEQRVKELEQERGELEAKLGDEARHEAEVRAITADRDWHAQEHGRLLEQLQIRRNAANDSMRRHYGRIALFDDASNGPLQELLRQQRLVAALAPQEGGSLKDLATTVQARMAQHKETDDDPGRRYRIDDVRAFFACLASSRMLVLKGLSGTGKTSLPLYAARALGGVCGIVKVQSGWRDRMDLVGTYNAFTEELRSQPFSELLYAASTDELKDRPYFIVLDECNLSRVEYYFADLLSELQEPKDEHRLRLLERAPGAAWPKHLDQGIELKIPRNVWFILTANEDESTFELADKTFDRSAVLQMNEQAPDRVDAMDSSAVPRSVSAAWLRKELQRVSRPSLDKERGEWIAKVQEAVLLKLGYGLGNRFPEQARSFVQVFTAMGGDPSHALDRLVASKVLRKVERERDPNRRSEVEAVQAVVKSIPGGSAPLCAALLERTIKGLR
jgi:hypothetical protein